MSDLSPLRIGRITSSRIAPILGHRKDSKTRRSVMREMVTEALGLPAKASNWPMERGKNLEAEALEEYRLVYPDRQVVASRDLTIVHRSIGFLAATCDAFVDDDGLYEGKAPWKAGYLHISERPDHEVQIRLQLECTDRDWCDYGVYRPGWPLAVSTVQRDPWWLESVTPTLEAFMSDYRTVLADPDLTAALLASRGRKSEVAA